MPRTPAADIEDIASPAPSHLVRSVVIGLMAFLTVVDLFAAQALLPSLTEHYNVSPSAMGLAVNACTFGMAAAGLAVALFGAKIDPRWGISASLMLLAVPTILLAFAPSIQIFAALRIVQGVLMATAFSLTLSHLGSRFNGRDATSAVAAYITGNVASNLFGRLISVSILDLAGLAAAFYVFAGLNILGAGLALATVTRMAPADSELSQAHQEPSSTILLRLLREPQQIAGFAIGFCILFAFIGTFTYINFILTKPPLSVGMMQLGLIYFVFLPSILTTPCAGALDQRLGTRSAIWVSLAAAGMGLPLLVSTALPAVLVGMALVAAGTFLAQAIAAGYVGRTAGTGRRAVASGLYLASYYLGGLAGTAVLGAVYDAAGWTACVMVIGLALGIAAALAITWNDAHSA